MSDFFSLLALEEVNFTKVNFEQPSRHSLVKIVRFVNEEKSL